MVWGSVPASSMWVAKACLRLCRPPALVMPALALAAWKLRWAVVRVIGRSALSPGNSQPSGRQARQ